MKNIVALLALSFGAWGCGGPEETGTQTRGTVQALVTAEGGVPGGAEEFLVEVAHDDNVSSDEARRIAANVRVRTARPRVEGSPILNPGVVQAVDLHWMLAEDHDVAIEVLPVDQDVNEDEFEWEWVDEAVVLPHCPEGRHNF